MTYSHILYYIS